jgi:uridine monophosphate synthetase
VTGFFAALEERARLTGAALCIGIDPRADTAAAALAAAQRLVAATSPVAAAFKPNAAFFEAFGADGIEALIAVVAAIPDEIPVILDAKRGDIASSAEGYARAAFEVIGAGAITVSPYLGRDALGPFLAREGRGIWVLCRTSNPTSAEIQGIALPDGTTVAERVAALATTWAGPDRLGLVVGATQPEALAAIRRIAPEHWILAPGVGAQGAGVDGLETGLRADGIGLLVTVSRAVADAPDPGEAARNLRDVLARSRPASPRPASLAATLHDAGCIRVGEFTLRSGTTSPIYVDLRALTGSAAALRRVAAAFVPALAARDFDHVAPVPYGAMPLGTAVALATDSSLVWPRAQPKEHGTSARVEGRWQPGDRVVLIDDVITSGASAVEAAALLRRAGLVVEHLVVLVERDRRARAALAEEGITLTAITTLAELVADLAAGGAISPEQQRVVEEFLAQ